MRPHLLLVGAAALAVRAQDHPSVRVVAENRDNISYIPLRADWAVPRPASLLRQSCPEYFDPLGSPHDPDVIHSSFDPPAGSSLASVARFDPLAMYPSGSSFIRGAVEAWAQHQDLVIRPDEVWLEILAQLGFYMKKNAEAVRDLFFAHKGKERLEIEAESGADLVQKLGRKMQEKTKAPWLAEWVAPGFSSSTPNDDLTAQALMMGVMQDYFEFRVELYCGLPSVSLRGTKADWERLRDKASRLREWGEEPAEYARVLAPILSRIVGTFDDADSAETREFWNDFIMVHHVPGDRCIPRSRKVRGWITGFSFWNSSGSPAVSRGEREASSGGVRLDGVAYAAREMKTLPISYAQVPVKARFKGTDNWFDAVLLAGNIGVRRQLVSDEESGTPSVTAEPQSGWYLIGPVDPGKAYQRSPDDRELSRIDAGLETCPESKRGQLVGG